MNEHIVHRLRDCLLAFYCLKQMLVSTLHLKFGSDIVFRFTFRGCPSLTTHQESELLDDFGSLKYMFCLARHFSGSHLKVFEGGGRFPSFEKSARLLGLCGMGADAISPYLYPFLQTVGKDAVVVQGNVDPADIPAVHRQICERGDSLASQCPARIALRLTSIGVVYR